MDSGIEDEIYFFEEVKDFYISNELYYCITTSGRIINIIKAINLQPPIEDLNHYLTVLWVEAKEGFFVFQQEIFNLNPQKWILEKQIIPKSSYNFFSDYIVKLKKEMKIEETI